MIHEEQRLVEEENRMNALKTRWKSSGCGRGLTLTRQLHKSAYRRLLFVTTTQLRATLEALASEFSAIDFRKPFTVELRDRGSDLLESQAQSITVHAGYLLKENTSSYGGNQFVLRCRDGVIVDGSDVRLSRRVHRSCCYRDLAPAEHPSNFLNVGQYVNNEPGQQLHIVQYVDFVIHRWPADVSSICCV
ncbi:hypothetical protein Y032_0011g1438 [Ancylostoma ceylanicum]|nr:hypothetical protein Y032_0011g1438 [Ancylostoma ceylanicum]